MQVRRIGWTAATLGAGLYPGVAGAQIIDLSIEIPRLHVAEYHKPYVAVWLEKSGVAPRTIQLWYDGRSHNGKGAKWLRDLRQWWRTSGRATPAPGDGISGATRPPGTQRLRLSGGRGGMPVLTPGSYSLVIEAAREAGGREVVRLPFAWTGATASGQAQGRSEIGSVRLTLTR